MLVTIAAMSGAWPFESAARENRRAGPDDVDGVWIEDGGLGCHHVDLVAQAWKVDAEEPVEQIRATRLRSATGKVLDRDTQRRAEVLRPHRAIREAPSVVRRTGRHRAVRDGEHGSGVRKAVAEHDESGEVAGRCRQRAGQDGEEEQAELNGAEQSRARHGSPPGFGGP
jgi:hypothetical protein